MELSPTSRSCFDDEIRSVRVETCIVVKEIARNVRDKMKEDVLVSLRCTIVVRCWDLQR